MRVRSKMSRFWRPKFSLKTQMAVVTLVCCYLACWQPTSTVGVDDVRSKFCEPKVYRSHVGPVARTIITTARLGDEMSDEIHDISPRLPLVIRVTENHLSEIVYRDYLWVFGWVVELPYEKRIQVRFDPNR